MTTARATARLSTGVVADAGAVLALVVFAWLAVQLHDSVAGLGDMATGIRDTGTAIQRSGHTTAQQLRTSIDQAVGAVEAVPVLGGDVGGAVRNTGESSAAWRAALVRDAPAPPRTPGRTANHDSGAA